MNPKLMPVMKNFSIEQKVSNIQLSPQFTQNNYRISSLAKLNKKRLMMILANIQQSDGGYSHFSHSLQVFNRVVGFSYHPYSYSSKICMVFQLLK